MAKFTGEISRSTYIAFTVLACLWTVCAIVTVWMASDVEPSLARTLGIAFGIGTLLSIAFAGFAFGILKTVVRTDAHKQVAYMKIIRLVWTVLIVANAALAIKSFLR